MSLQFGQVASWLVIESEQREGDESGSLTIISWNETIEAHRREVRLDPGHHCGRGRAMHAVGSDWLSLTMFVLTVASA